jgi:DNA polymerase III subunit gamma/tau
VKFLLATTDPQKLPATILSRCLQFNLKNMTPERIVGYLQHVLGEEQVTFEDPALWLLGRAAQGSMRDALSLTDQAISFGQGQLKEIDVASMLGTVDRGRVFALANALAGQDVAEVLSQIAKMAEHAVDFANVLADLIELLHRVAIAQALPDAIDNSQGDREYVLALADAISPADVQLFYQTALMGKRDLPLAPEPRAGLEMTLLRMLTFRPVVEGDLPKKLVSRPRSVSETTAAVSAAPVAPSPVAFKPAPVSVAPPVPETPSAPVNSAAVMDSQPAEVSSAAVAVANTDVPVVPKTENFPPWLDEPEGDIPSEYGNADDSASEYASMPIAPEVTVAVAPAKMAAVEMASPVAGMSTSAAEVVEPSVDPEPEPTLPEEPLNAADLSPQSWPILFVRLALDGMLKSLMSNSSLMQFDGHTAVFHLDPGHLRLLNENHQQKFMQVFAAAFGSHIAVRIQEGDCQYETPAQRQQRLAYEKQQRAIASIMADAHVQTLQNAFNAQVIVDSIESLL